MLHTCKYQIFSRGIDAFSCPFMTAFICTQERREAWHPHSVQQLSRTRCFGTRHEVESNHCSSLSRWINHIPRGPGRWQKVTTARDRKQFFHPTLPIKQQPGGRVVENNGRGQQHNQAAYEDVLSDRKLSALVLYCISYVYGTKVPPATEFRVCTFLAPRWSHIAISSSKVGAFSWGFSKKKGPLSGKRYEIKLWAIWRTNSVQK